jgi:hypothetical protein
MTDHHYYASSIATWMTTNDKRNLGDLINTMNAEPYDYTLWYVPLPHDAAYEIEGYAPVVPDATRLGTVRVRK